MRYEDLVEDIVEYNKCNSFEEAEKMRIKIDKETINKFPKNPTDKQLKEYYSNNFSFSGLRRDAYLFNIVRDSEATKICLYFGCKEVLDFGCGIGNSVVVADENGLHMTACDVEGQTLDFVKFRVKKKCKHTRVVNLEELDWNKKYDAIFCYDVLEHLKNPSEIIVKLMNMIKPQGLFLFTIQFSGTDIEPAHITSKEEAKKTIDVLNKRMKMLGALIMPNRQKHILSRYPIVAIFREVNSNES